MSQYNILWCHGAQSQPWGTKSAFLAEVTREAGATLEAPDFSDLENPDARADRLVELLAKDGRPALLIGSSMGGYVASVAAREADVKGLLLMAPAFYLPGYDVHVFSGLPDTISVIHGWDDDVVPAEHSVRFAQQHKASLHLLPDGHLLADSLPMLRTLFTDFLAQFTE